MKNKRFVVACVGIIFTSLTICFLSWQASNDIIVQLAEIYKWVIGSVCVGYFGVQSFTDIKKGDKNVID